MTIEIITIPCLSDNYAFLIHETDTGETALVDAPDSHPILAELEKRKWSLSTALLTHHHNDHIDGLPEILEKHPANVVGARADRHRLPALDTEVQDGDEITVCGQKVLIWDVSGHTIGHIAFIMRSANAAFTADSLMALGCGRLLEGTPAQMWESLSKFAELPDDTMIYSGHEYTASNAKFALSIDPDNADLQARTAEISQTRASGGFTVPSSLGAERRTNPFLRASDPILKNILGMQGKSDAAVFAEIRGRKDRF